eukprot:IDg16588t1
MARTGALARAIICRRGMAHVTMRAARYRPRYMNSCTLRGSA